MPASFLYRSFRHSAFTRCSVSLINRKLISATLSVSVAIAVLAAVLPSTGVAGDPNRTPVEWIRIDPDEGVVRVKTKKQNF